MKLIIKEYLSSLKERGELDAILPDLLSQMGLNVLSSPGRGTRQNGVDVAAVGSLNGNPEKLHLFSIKAGDLTRQNWNGQSVQDLRPSLEEILDNYILNSIPVEHRSKDIVIYIVIGGEVKEQVRGDVEGYKSRNTDKYPKVKFDTWNGDKLAEYIQLYFLREEILSDDDRSLLRKSLAMLDEPEVSFKHFKLLIGKLFDIQEGKKSESITVLRQMSICLWILVAWSRQEANIESSYLAAEYTLLRAWEIYKGFLNKKSKKTLQAKNTFFSIFDTYFQISNEYLDFNILPYAEIQDGISVAIRGLCRLDTNEKLFDLIGRLGIAALWSLWICQINSEKHVIENARNYQRKYDRTIRLLVANNSELLLPAKDERAIDITIAAFSIIITSGDKEFIKDWFFNIAERSKNSYQAHSKYPTVLRSYQELLEHPKNQTEEYRKSVTSGSILYPTIALWAALLEDEKTYNKIFDLKKLMPHCTFQIWFPDESSENCYFSNRDMHGAALLELDLSSQSKLKEQVFKECDETQYFEKLSAVENGWWPLIILASRHYRMPPPVQILNGLRETDSK